MPLWILVSFVVFGLAIVIGAVHRFGGKRKVMIDRQTAADIWNGEFEAPAVSEVVISDDRKTAILALKDHAGAGLVRQMGAHHIVRRLDAGSLSSVDETGKQVKLGLSETTLPYVLIEIDDDEERALMIAMLENLVAEREVSHA